MNTDKKVFLNYTVHDLKVIGFHVGVAAVLGIITEISKVNFGGNTPLILLLLQAAAEALRRYIA